MVLTDGEGRRGEAHGLAEESEGGGREECGGGDEQVVGEGEEGDGVEAEEEWGGEEWHFLFCGFILRAWFGVRVVDRLGSGAGWTLAAIEV